MNILGNGRGGLRRGLFATAVLALLAGGAVTAAPAPANAAGACGSACEGISGDPATLAKQLGGYVSAGVFEATQPEGPKNDLYTNEILPIANGNPTPSCQLDLRVLQTLVITVKQFGSVKIHDLNRRCTTMSHSYTCANNESSKHCVDPSLAIDFGYVGGVQTIGTNARTHELLDFLDTFVPSGTGAGQDPCKENGGSRGWSFTNITRQFSDFCTHQHIDFSSVSGPLRITATTAAVAPAVAFQTNTNELYTWTGGAGTLGFGGGTKLGVKPGTTPAVKTTGSSTAVALNASDGSLWTWSGKAGTVGFGTSAHVGMMAGTSPSITLLQNGNYAIAFQANDTQLWTWTGAPGTPGFAAKTGLGMKAGTSPSITAIGNNVAVAFQANTGSLYTWSGAPATLGYGADAKLGVRASTSPSITTVGSSVAVAFQSSGGNLYTWSGAPGTIGFGADARLGMRDKTSPSIATVGSGVAVALQANTGSLYTWTGAPATIGFGATTNLGMKDGTSPSITPTGTNVSVALIANTGSLYTWLGAPGTQGFGADAKLGTGAGSSPTFG